LDSSLQRLRTDYIDIYQLHWPDREPNDFSKLGYSQAAGEHCGLLAYSPMAFGVLSGSHGRPVRG
jgi:aryl-alcohol dehydrogenase-like predicted oxidoreductase